MTEPAPLPTVTRVDLTRYLGTWFEICRLPLKWEDRTAEDITATYSLNDDGSIRVDNRCLDAEGKPTQALGRAHALDDSNARLTVTFLPAFLRWLPYTSGDYQILKLDPEYRYALVGEPRRRYLWLLAREPSIPDAVREDYLAHAVSVGYRLDELITPRQSGRQVTDEMLGKG